MPRRGGNSKKVALSGLMSALSLTLMMLGSVLPFSEYIAVVVAGLVIIVVSGELGLRYAFCVYASVSILALILLPVKEIALLFVMLFGYYPLIKYRLDSLGRFLKFFSKFGLFNLSMTVAYTIVLYLFTTPELQSAMENWRVTFIVALYIMGNIFFVVYDKFVVVAWQIYFKKVAPIIRKIF